MVIMKTFIFCCLIALGKLHDLVTCTTDEDDQHRQHYAREDAGNAPMSKLVSTAKHVLASESGFRRGNSVEMCALNCVKQMTTSLHGDIGIADFNTQNQLPYRFNDRFNPAKLEKFCSIMNRTLDCVQPCSDGQGKQMADAALTLTRFVCIDSFMQHASCLHGINKEEKSACDSKCSTEISNLQRTINGQPSTMTDIQAMFGQTCEYVDCDTDCDYAKVSQQCGTDTANAYLGYYTKSIEGAKTLFDVMGLQISFPTSCNNVGMCDVN